MIVLALKILTDELILGCNSLRAHLHLLFAFDNALLNSLDCTLCSTYVIDVPYAGRMPASELKYE